MYKSEMVLKDLLKHRLLKLCGDWLTGRHLQDLCAALMTAVSHKQRIGNRRVTQPLSLSLWLTNAIWRLKTKTCQSALLLCYSLVCCHRSHPFLHNLATSGAVMQNLLLNFPILSSKYKLLGKTETTIYK